MKLFQLGTFETETHDYCDRHNYVVKVYCKSNLAVSKSLFGDKMWILSFIKGTSTYQLQQWGVGRG